MAGTLLGQTGGMKILLSALFALTVAAGSALGQVVTLTVKAPDDFSDKSVVLKQGDYAEVLDSSNPDISNINIDFPEGSLRKSMISVAGAGSATRNPPVIAGPATIRARNVSASAVGYVTLRVTRQGTDGIIPVPQSPSNTDYEVFLEASSDMETWVRVIPGDYSSNGAAKFFRVRMVAK